MNRKLVVVVMAAMRIASAQTATGSELKLSGRWTAGRISSIQYQDAVTGRAAPTNGNSFAFEFREDGTYSFTGLMHSVMHQCTATMFSNETGTYMVSGGMVSLRPEKNPYKMTNSCAPSSNREAAGKLVNRTFQVRIYRDGQTARMELEDAEGAVQTFSASSHK